MLLCNPSAKDGESYVLVQVTVCSKRVVGMVRGRIFLIFLRTLMGWELTNSGNSIALARIRV